MKLFLPIVAALTMMSCGGSSDDDGDDDKGKKSEKFPQSAIVVYAPGDKEWSGSVGFDSSTSTQSGFGYKVFDAGTADIWTIAVQKQTEGDWELKAECYKYGNKQEESATTAEYGVVSVTCSF